MASYLSRSSTTFLNLSSLPSAPPRRLPIKTQIPLFTKPRNPISTTTRTPIRSIDVSKEEQPTPVNPPQETQPGEGLDGRRRPEEKFAVLNTGVHRCRSCGYTYNQAKGDPPYPIPPGLPFAELPGDWRCPTCGASQSFFESKSVEVAGFAQNQDFGFGANTLTSGQKLLLIYGALLLGFVLFLSGYFLQ
ncbi:unnamed protein product [Cuscuta campestris]|uniref:Rubredoxin-like domain-containing protein n=1 Tax=Cuscuta campestris TaxID=132261 RepID=A0A484K4Z0_9ASTE|nr:unnamed protein product [Cuscuta campestris]